MPSTAKTLLFIHTLTGLHPGSGTALGVVDLPVQRERHTQWPLIPGSSLKGILRDACRESIKDSYRDATQQQNGISDHIPDGAPDSGQTKKTMLQFLPFLAPAVSRRKPAGHSGALSITDARILAFPVRSLTGVFA